MVQYNVTGMSCAACSARVEKAVSKLDGVTTCSVSLLTNSMGVEGTAAPEDVIKAVENAGYGASLKGKNKGGVQKEEAPSFSKETKELKIRLVTSLVFLLFLMYVSMGHMMWNWPLPKFLDGNHVAMGLYELLLTVAVMVINRRFFVSGFKSLARRSPNMDALVALGSTAAFVYSTYALFKMTGAVLAGDAATVESCMNDLYFESAAMILTLITVGKLLESRSKGKTTDALKSLMKLAPKTATLEKDGKEQTVPIESVAIGDIFVVRPGESIPVDKTVGDSVSAATVNRSGFLKCRASRVGEDTTLSQIIKMVSDAAATKAPIAKIADKVSGVFVPTVIALAILTTVVWLVLGESFGYALSRGISVLVISCPCALGLATPVAVMVGNGLGAKNGILFKTAAALEETSRIDIVALDKTGTVTSGEPTVTDIVTNDGVSYEELLKAAFSLESKSEHPLSKAVIKKALEEGIKSEEVLDFEALPGNGLKAALGADVLRGGNLAYIGANADVPEDLKEKALSFAEKGKTPLFFSRNSKALGVIAVADVIKPDSKDAVSELKKMGVNVVMLTGDNARTAKAIGDEVGVDAVISDVLPNGKETIIRKLKEYGKVAMVGDGINDAPALTTADIGIAIGAGTDVAIDAADVVLMNSRLSDVPAALRLGRATLRNIHENLFWAFFYNSVGIPLAMGVFVPLGLTLNPMFGAAAMSLSSFCVVSNALRLNLFKLHSPKYDRKRKHKEINFSDVIGKIKEENKMTKTLKINGMMCSHCEMTVKKALEAVDGVESAVVSHEKGTAVVTLKKDVDSAALKSAVEAKDYEVTSVE